MRQHRDGSKGQEVVVREMSISESRANEGAGGKLFLRKQRSRGHRLQQRNTNASVSLSLATPNHPPPLLAISNI